MVVMGTRSIARPNAYNNNNNNEKPFIECLDGRVRVGVLP